MTLLNGKGLSSKKKELLEAMKDNDGNGNDLSKE